MDKNKYNKKVLIILRILLFIGGFSVGFAAIWQVMHSDAFLIKGWLKYVFYAVSGLVPALVLLLSAKPVYLLLKGLASKVLSRFHGLKGEDAAGIILAAVLSILAGYLCDFVLSLFIDILALRIVIDFFAALAAFYGVAVLFFKVLKKYGAEHKEDDDSLKPRQFFGYIFTSGALSNPKSESLISQWLNGDIYALDLYNNAQADKNSHIKYIQSAFEMTESVQIANTALLHELKIIADESEDVTEYEKRGCTVLFVGRL